MASDLDSFRLAAKIAYALIKQHKWNLDVAKEIARPFVQGNGDMRRLSLELEPLAFSTVDQIVTRHQQGIGKRGNVVQVQFGSVNPA